MPRICHFELPADDVPRAIAFYEKVLGWKFTKWDGPMDYWLIATGESSEPGINGGLSLRQAGEGVTNIADVKDLDATIKSAVEQGATVVMEKHEIPGVGYLAYIKDTENNVLGLMQEL